MESFTEKKSRIWRGAQRTELRVQRAKFRVQRAKFRVQGAEKLLPYLVLSVLTAALLFLPVPEGAMFGSEGDWYSQHVGAAEAIRQTMLRQETIFPQFAGLGGGINAYDLAYYGLLRPDIILSYFLPGVEMRQLIALYAAAGVFAAVNLTYFWLKRRNLDTTFAFCGGLLTAAASCFFHAHHQIIFVNYMPFLVTAFLGIDRLLEKKKGGLLSLSVFFICMHSFYYAPVCMLVCLIYGLYRLADLRKTGLSSSGVWNCALRGMLSALLGICLSAVLLLPVGLDILSTGKDAGRFLSEPMKAVDLSFGSLLYQPYGCGMTLTALYCLLLSLGNRRKRLPAAVLLTMLAVPAVWYALSGFLYPRAKVLIPLTPLLAWICADTLQEILKGRQKPYLWAAALCLIPVLYAPQQGIRAAVLYLDAAAVLVFSVLQYLKRLPVQVKRAGFALLLVIPLCVSFGTNLFLEDYLAEDDERQSRFSFADITMFASEPNYRFDYLANNYINSNVLPDGGLNKTACYLSVTNEIYADFFYNTMRNPISLRNRVVLMPGGNPLFDWFMGIRYVLAPENRVPYGYRPVFRRNGFVLAENEDVLPVCYGTDRLLSEDELKKLNFPENAAALCGVSVRKEDAKHFFAKGFPKNYEQSEGYRNDRNHDGRDHDGGDFGGRYHDGGDRGGGYRNDRYYDGRKHDGGDFDGRYRSDMPRDGNCRLPLRKPLKNRVLILSFDVVRADGREVSISVNGMKNNLSSKSAPYPNGNETFTFVLAPQNGAESIDALELDFSKGDYDIENLQVYTAETPSLEKADISRAAPDRENNVRFTFSEGSPVFSGTVDMKNDGYFVTSYPYKEGYRILADGKRVKPERVNGAFIGFPLKEGVHEIRITYIAPGFRAGLGVSLAAVILFIAAVWRKGEKHD